MSNGSFRRYVSFLGASVFLAYFSLALTLPILSRHVITTLGFPGWIGGLAVGALFVATVFTRPYSGRLADRLGGRHCCLFGLVSYLAASAICVVSGLAGLPPAAALAILLAGRLILGLGESLMTVGAITWAISAFGSARSGLVLVVMGTAIYGAYAVGGPLGVAIYDRYGFITVALAAAVPPLLIYPTIRPLADSPVKAGAVEKPGVLDILRRIYKYGTIVALQGIGFAVIGAFISPYFIFRNWLYAGWALTCFSVAFVLVRLVFGKVPDRLGGVPVTLVSLCVEAAGLALLWQAPGVWYAFLGAFLAGFGCSLVYPSMGIVAISQVPDKFRGTAFGLYASFLDVSYALTGPLAGLAADYAGYGSVFFMGFIAVGIAVAMTLSLFPARAGKTPPGSA